MRCPAIAFLVGILAAPLVAQDSLVAPAPTALTLLQPLDASLKWQSPSPRVKSPTAAGTMSALLPGAGSFYAGNIVHGVTHLAIHVLSAHAVVTNIEGQTKCQSQNLDSCNYRGLGRAAAWLVIFIGNDVKSIVTAVADARTFNVKAAESEPRVGLHFGSGVRILEAIPIDGRVGSANLHLGLEVASIRF